MPACNHAAAIRQGSTPIRIEKALASGSMTLREIADQLNLSPETVRNQMSLIDAVPAGSVRIRMGRPRVRYALRGTPAARACEPEVGKHITVLRVEQALWLQPMTIAELCRVLSLSETSIRWALPRTRAVAVGSQKPRHKHGRWPVVYGLPSNTSRCCTGLWQGDACDDTSDQ